MGFKSDPSSHFCFVFPVIVTELTGQVFLLRFYNTQIEYEKQDRHHNANPKGASQHCQTGQEKQKRQVHGVSGKTEGPLTHNRVRWFRWINWSFIPAQDHECTEGEISGKQK